MESTGSRMSKNYGKRSDSGSREVGTMMQNLLESLNALLLHHPHLLHLMRIFFWIKHWILMGIMGVFIYLIYTDDRQPLPQRRKMLKPASDDVFVA